MLLLPGWASAPVTVSFSPPPSAQDNFILPDKQTQMDRRYFPWTLNYLMLRP